MKEPKYTKALGADFKGEIPVDGAPGVNVSDQGLRIKEDAWALIWSPKDGWSLVTPKLEGPNQVPTEALALTAMFVKLDSAEYRHDGFMQEQADWFKDVAS